MSLVTHFLFSLSHLFLVKNVAVAFLSEWNVAVIIYNFTTIRVSCFLCSEVSWENWHTFSCHVFHDNSDTYSISDALENIFQIFILTWPCLTMRIKPEHCSFKCLRKTNPSVVHIPGISSLLVYITRRSVSSVCRTSYYRAGVRWFKPRPDQHSGS